MNTPTEITNVPFADIIIPAFIERDTHKTKDDITLKSIQKSGIQQPFVLVRDGNKLLLAKGSTRIRLGRIAGLTRGPAVIHDAPKGVAPMDWARQLRGITALNRQDLLPTQYADLVLETKDMFKLKNRDLAKMFGCTADTITNVTAVKNYIEPVRRALDAGAQTPGGLTGNRARVLDGFTTVGQEAVWKKYGKDLIEKPPKVMYVKVRREFSPQSHPHFYRDAEASAKRLSRPQRKRRVNPRADSERSDRLHLMNTVGMRQSEQAANAERLTRYEREIKAAKMPVRQIMRNETVLAALPKRMREQLERFVEVMGIY